MVAGWVVWAAALCFGTGVRRRKVPWPPSEKSSDQVSEAPKERGSFMLKV